MGASQLHVPSQGRVSAPKTQPGSHVCTDGAGLTCKQGLGAVMGTLCPTLATSLGLCPPPGHPLLSSSTTHPLPFSAFHHLSPRPDVWAPRRGSWLPPPAGSGTQQTHWELLSQVTDPFHNVGSSHHTDDGPEGPACHFRDHRRAGRLSTRTEDHLVAKFSTPMRSGI